MGTRTWTALQFRILGPLAAYWDDDELELGGERQRALLAVLLVHSGQIVSSERLIDQLFRGSRPQSASNSLRVAVSRLRRALRDDDGATVGTRPGGYMLTLDPERLDSAVFERLLGEGRELLRQGDAAAA